MSLGQRTLESATWTITANLVSIVVGFVRSVLLARWLPVEVFGVYALAFSIVRLSVMVTDFGMSGAFVHRAPETEDEGRAAAVHFTFRVSFTLIWAALLVGGAFLFTSGQLRTALLLITATTGGMGLTATPGLILMRRVTQQRTAMIQSLNAVISTLIVLGLAWRGVTLWALLTGNLVAVTLKVVLLYIWRPVWRPRLAWDPYVMRYFLRFGRHNFLNAILYEALDRIDDIWVGLYLGETATGLYSRAYTFATYPRQILAEPVNWVVGGAYAELKGDRLRLSRAFFYVNAILVRSAFFLAGLLALVAPEFIRLLLGEKWLPMLHAFRLMLIFTLFDPIKVTVSSLIGLAGGKPERVARTSLVQLVVMVVGLFLLGPLFGIAGVALAVDGMLVVGIAVLLWQARDYADYSLKRLFAAPCLALIIGLVLAVSVVMLPGVAGSDWRAGFMKILAFSTTYGIILLLSDRHHLSEMLIWLNIRSCHNRAQFREVG
jgi:O-antigen/teichoic acid export membrane protein